MFVCVCVCVCVCACLCVRVCVCVCAYSRVFWWEGLGRWSSGSFAAMSAPVKQTPRRGGQSQWALAAVAGLAAVVGLMVAGNNVYLSSEPYFGNAEASMIAGPSKLNLRHELKQGKAPVPTVMLTPEVVRALLTMDEKDQMALVIDPKTPEEKTAQREVIHTCMDVH